MQGNTHHQGNERKTDRPGNLVAALQEIKAAVVGLLGGARNQGGGVHQRQEEPLENTLIDKEYLAYYTPGGFKNTTVRVPEELKKGGVYFVTEVERHHGIRGDAPTLVGTGFFLMLYNGPDLDPILVNVTGNFENDEAVTVRRGDHIVQFTPAPYAVMRSGLIADGFELNNFLKWLVNAHTYAEGGFQRRDVTGCHLVFCVEDVEGPLGINLKQCMEEMVEARDRFEQAKGQLNSIVKNGKGALLPDDRREF